MHAQVTEGQVGVSLRMSAAQKQLLACILLACRKHKVSLGGLPLRKEGVEAKEYTWRAAAEQLECQTLLTPYLPYGNGQSY